MSGSILTSRKLITSIKRRAFIPRSQETFTEDDLLEMATEEVNISLMRQLIGSRGDYLVYNHDEPLLEDTFRYAIPDRAHGNKLREVTVVDANGLVQCELSQVDLDEVRDYQDSFSTVNYSNTFYLQNNEVVLTSSSFNSSGYSLRMSFYLRPNKLVLDERAATVNSIVDNNDGTTTFSFMTLPRHFTNLLQYDITCCKSPNKIVNYNLVPVSVNTTLKTIVFNTADIAGVIVGDYVTQAEETIVPNLPTEYHPILAQLVAVACLEAMGDEQNKQSAERKLKKMQDDVSFIVANRVEGAHKKIRNRTGPLRQGLSLNRRNTYRS